MKGFKGFNKGMVCREKVYTEGETYEEDIAELCSNGMHFCDEPSHKRQRL